MILSKVRMCWLGLGALWAIASTLPAFADDTELFIGTSLSSQATPNIMFVIDNSGSMGTLVLTQDGYNGAVTYPAVGNCRADRIYWRTGIGNPPDCDTDRWFNATALRCKRAQQAFLTAGYYTDNMAQYDNSTGSGGRRWENISTSQRSRVVECQDDRGYHGETDASADKYARNGPTTGTPPAGGRWGNSSQEIAWGATPANETYTIYSGNYFNWAYGPTGFKTRLEIVQDVAMDLLDSINGVNVGLMTFNRNNDENDSGGWVVYPMENIDTARAPIQEAVKNLTPTGFTPLSETMYEAAMYYTGGPVTFGLDSVAESRDPKDSNQYDSPFEYDCQKNFIVYLTDGEPTRDDAADGAIVEMTDEDTPTGTFKDLVGDSCDVETYPAGFSPSGGDCLDDLAEFLHEGDFSTLPGDQNVATYTVGFTIDLPILADTAERGGGRYYTADDTATLANALTNIVTAILSLDTTFSSPTVAVNSFNRTQNLSDLFISVFRPTGRSHWPGNLKKYTVRASDGAIVDAKTPPEDAIDPETGFFSAAALSHWSQEVDGATVDIGGAAALIPRTNRVVYTNLNGTELTAVENRISQTNATLTNAVLNTGLTGDPTREQVIDFINGIDASDVDGDSDRAEARRQMGDPLHSQPVSMVYGPGLRQGLVFMGTNDGFLHAIDLETGDERWAFVPAEFLDDQVELFKNDSEASKHYGIDSDLVIQVVADNDTEIEDDEKVYLFFGLGRGGEAYYGLDVSDPFAPELMWRIDSSTLPGLGQSWSPPMPTHVDIAGAMQNDDQLALVIGGGYEADQDSSGLTTDGSGNSIYIVDSEEGTLLWHGSRDGVHKDFNISGRAMDYSIPARIRTVDIDGDGYVDRMYAGDMGGQVWRFDVTKGASATDLVVGGVIAQLGGAPSATPAPEDVRRFYNAPDVAFIHTRERNFIHVGIGSGHRGHPLSLTVEDAFYALRDASIGALTQTQFDGLTPIVHDDLVPITSADTDVGSDEVGWRVDLSIGGWNGEKVLSEARTFANQVFFSTFQPSTGAMTCQPQLGTNRTYIMSVYNGAPVMNLDGEADDDELTMDDLFVESEGGILPAAEALFLDQDSDADGIPDIEDDGDEDGLSDAADSDDDGDGIADEMEDLDNDGIPNISDGDDDGDGMADNVDNDDTRANANEDPDGDTIPNYLDDDDDGDGVLDQDDDDDDVVFVGRQGYTGVMSNNPVRTFWSQEQTD